MYRIQRGAFTFTARLTPIQVMQYIRNGHAVQLIG